jgi:branched-subunit amino acid aminotransferase/4-amino-4-deoxychorismate lyase
VTAPMVWVDGRLLPVHLATISAVDRGFRSGEGVFETVRVREGRTFRLASHLERLQGTAAALGLHVATPTLLEAVAAVVTANGHLGADLVVRITCSAGPVDLTRPFAAQGDGPATVVVTAQRTRTPGAPPLPPASGHLVDLHRPLAEWKSTSYQVALTAQREARRHGASDALLCDAAGRALEAATANLFAVSDATLITAPLTAGVLPGITRAAVIAIAAEQGLVVDERPISRSELPAVAEALLTSAVRGVQPLVRLGGRPVGDGMPGPTTRRLAAALEAVIAATSLPVPSTGADEA